MGERAPITTIAPAFREVKFAVLQYRPPCEAAGFFCGAPNVRHGCGLSGMKQKQGVRICLELTTSQAPNVARGRHATAPSTHKQALWYGLGAQAHPSGREYSVGAQARPRQASKRSGLGAQARPSGRELSARKRARDSLWFTEPDYTAGPRVQEPQLAD